MIEMENNKTEDLLYLDVVEMSHVEELRKWRNQASNGVYRTSYKLSFNMQQEFFENVISNRLSNTKYYSIKKKIDDSLIGVSGIVGIQWENGLGEISLTLDPKEIGKGYGEKSLLITLDEAFNTLRLKNVYGECYECNQKLGFWKRMSERYKAYTTILPSRKFFDGELYDSFYFNFNSSNFYKEKKFYQEK